MNRFLLLIAAIFIAYPALADDEYLIVPGESVGIIKRGMTEEDLKKLVTPEEYSRDIIDIGEGYGRLASTIYKGTPKEVSILWKSAPEQIADVDWKTAWDNAVALEKPDYALIVAKDSPWHIAEGIKIGTTIQKLKKINGGSFTFAGFGWDYGGRTQSWEGGKISKYLTIELNSPGDEKYQQELVGDRLLSAENPAVRNIPLYVDMIMVNFAP